MGKIHDRLQELGRQGALAFMETDVERKALEAAYDFMADENGGIGFLFSGWCQTALPHRKLPDDQVWSVKTDYVRLMVEPGSIERNDVITRVGVPYGSRARLILLYLQSEAIRTNSRQIELGRSLRVWLGKLGVPIGGKSMKDVRDQALRLSRCRMSFQITQGDRIGFINQNLVDTAMFASDDGGALLETVHLSERFFDELKRHPVPLQEAAIKALSNNSQALDIYCWLAYRLHSLAGKTTISWAALMPQFGGAYSQQKEFRRRFIESLQIALAVYPDAKVEVIPGGLRLDKSKPPVLPRS
jgi:hypothetical protein